MTKMHTMFVSLTAVVLSCSPSAAGQTPGDISGDGTVNVDDLLGVITAWGPRAPPPALCSADTNHDGIVNVDDVIVVIVNWS